MKGYGTKETITIRFPIMVPRNGALLTLMLASLSWPLAAGANQSGPACSADAVESGQAGGQPTMPPAAQRVMGWLAEGDSAADHIAGLEQYLETSASGSRPADFVLRNYARLMLGGAYIRQQRFAEARRLLSEVRLDSPAGVETALLIARSHLLEGNREAALKWYMRVGERYPASPRVLASLLEQAENMAETGNQRLAASLYQRVLKKALANVEDLGSVTREPDEIAATILNRKSARDSAATVSGQLIRQLMRSPQSEALPHLRRMLDAQRRLECLASEQEKLEEKLFSISERGARAGSFETMLKRERDMLEGDIRSLEARVEQVRRDSERQALREELADRREKLVSLNQRLKELAKQSAVPQELQESKNRLDARQAELEAQLEESRQTIRRELEEVVRNLKKEYLDLAGEGQMGRARMMRELAVSNGS